MNLTAKPTLNEFAALKRESRPRGLKEKQGEYEVIKQAAVSMQNLTGHSEWDRFLSYIQAAIDDAEVQIEGLKAGLANPLTINHEEMLRIKLGLAEVSGWLKASKSILQLPQDLISMGDKVRPLIDSYVDRDG